MPSMSPEREQEIIEIKIWDVFLLHQRNNLNALLNQYAVDHGPVHREVYEPGRVVYRFYARDYERSVKPELFEKRIPIVEKYLSREPHFNEHY